MTVSVTRIDTIRKRDGRVVLFDFEKIVGAITRAFSATGRSDRRGVAEELAEQVLSILEEEGTQGPGVEHIQDVVERVLIENGYVQTAKNYILYRAERTRVREMGTRLMRIYEDITFRDASDSDIKRENANIDGDTAMGTMLKYGSEGAKRFNEMFVLNPVHARAHREGDIHIHDLDFLTLTTTCCQIDLLQLFEKGFSTGHGTLREPSYISSYAALACIAIQSNQNDQHGGQSVHNFDYAMARGVRKTFVSLYRENLVRALDMLAGLPNAREVVDGLTASGTPTLENCEDYHNGELELLRGLCPDVSLDLLARAQASAHRYAAAETDRHTYKAMVAFIHNLNTMHSRAGAQTPFSSINYGLDLSPEGRMAIKNVLLATEAGLGNGETPIFPIQIFRVKDGISSRLGDPNYDLFQLACRVSAQRLFPNFSFLDAPFNAAYYKPGHPETEVAYMGCRTRVLGNVYDPEQEISNGRGNLSFTSINLPRLAIRARGNLSFFFEELDRKLDLVIEQLHERYLIQARKKVRNFPFLMGQGVWLGSDKLGWDDEIGEVLKHGTLTVGFIGLAETLKALIGAHHGESERAQNLGLEIVTHMRARLDEVSQVRQMNYTLIATPAEGLSGRFVRLDREKYGLIPGVTDREYYTNSFHIPVYFPLTAFRKIALEGPYHALTNAGHITYVELDGDPMQNLAAFEKVVHAMRAAGVGYGSINHPIDRDPACGYSGVIDDTCPRCGRVETEDAPFERIRRITGYLVGTLDRFNDAKRAETRDRVKHNIT